MSRIRRAASPRRPRRPRKPSPQLLRDCEQAIAAFEQATRACEQEAAAAFAEGRHQDGTRAAWRLAELQSQLDKRYQTWLTLQEQCDGG